MLPAAQSVPEHPKREPEPPPLKPKSIACIKQYKAWISHQKVCVFTHVWNQWRKRMGHTAGTQRPVDGVKKQH